MGCGCNGRRNSVRSATVTPNSTRNLQQGITARQIQSQSDQRQALVQKAKEQLQQQSLPQSNRNLEIERKRRIQISLRNRQKKN